MTELVVGPLFDPFRDDERFQHMLRRMGLDPEIGLRLRDRDPAWLARQ